MYINRNFMSELNNKIKNALGQELVLKIKALFNEHVVAAPVEEPTKLAAEVVLKDGSKVWATYLFTVDWYKNPYSDEPSDYKCGHILIADDGYLMCQPNNRIYWKDSNWVTKEFPFEPKLMKVDEHMESVESHSDRWVSEDGNSYYYNIKENGTK